MRIVYDAKRKRPGCVLLQAVEIQREDQEYETDLPLGGQGVDTSLSTEPFT